MDSDFNQLYAQLELRPDCTLDEFKRAYRRRVAELHPDRHPEASATARAMALSELTSLYTTATRFHRAHGRLPGAAPAQRSPDDRGPEQLPRPVARRLDGMPSPPRSQERADATRRTRLAALIVLSIVVLIVILEASTPDSDARREPAPTQSPTAAGQEAS